MTSLLNRYVPRTEFDSYEDFNENLKITVPEDLNFEGVFDEILNTNTTSWNMVKVRTRDFGALYELNYSIHLKNDVNQKKFIDSLRVRNGNLNISLTSCGSEDKIFN